MRSLILLSIVSLLLLTHLEAKKYKSLRDVQPKPVVSGIHEEGIVEDESYESKLIRPKNLRVITAYDKCKMECKRQRDNQGLLTYVEQLKAELAAAEAIINEQENAASEETNENEAVS